MKLWIVLAAATAALAQERLVLEDLARAPGGRGGAALSPDGKRFATVENGQIALLPSAGGASVPVTSSPGAKTEVSWSADSQKLAFVSQGGIWTVAATPGATPKRLTDGPVGPGDPRGATDHAPSWNPKGKWILYQSGRRGQDELYVVAEEGGDAHFLAPAEIYEGADHLGPASDDRGDAVSGDRFEPHPAWSPDGARVSYTERSRKIFSGKIKMLAFDHSTGRAKGAPTDLYTARNDRGGAWAVNTVAWSPDGKTLAVVLQESGWDKIYLIPSGGDPPRQLTRGEYEDEDPVYSPDGKSLAIVSNRGKPEERHIWIVPIGGGPARPVADLGPGVESAPHWSSDAATIYFQRATPFRPAAMYVASTTGGAAHPFVPPPANKFEHVGLPTPEAVHYPAHDGLTIGGILFRPLGYKPGARYPTVIWAHGGPEGQDMLTFSPWSLFLAQEGYVVLMPNFRGSTGYGERFRNLNVEDSGGGEIDDIASSVKYLIAQGLADPKRIAIGGGSHGGTVVVNAVTKLPDLFAAGMDLYGVVDRALFLQFTNRNSKIRWETKMGGTPEEKPAVYRKANILPDVGRIRAPMLILHGEQDPQVPPKESAQLAEALRAAGKAFTYFTYPREGHGFTEREHRLDAWQKQLDFLKQYLGPN
jgi:dipeptidyl aminopeptidase/acylaminoacyl peptidase